MVAVVAMSQLIGPIIFRAALGQMREIGASAGGLVVVSNREPWVHERAADGSIVATPTPGGVSVALDALMRERGGVWIAHGAGSADRDVVDERSSVEVPPDAPAYRLRRLWLTPEQEERYYAGFSNSALWPLCHQAHVRPVFRAEDWDAYQEVNRLFADAVAVEAPPDSLGVPQRLPPRARRRSPCASARPLLQTALFWHIPWPDVDRLRICPWRREILEGLLSNDLLAFQLPRDQRNFLNAVTEELGASVSGETVLLRRPSGARAGDSDWRGLRSHLDDPGRRGARRRDGAALDRARPRGQGRRRRRRSARLHEGHSGAHRGDRSRARERSRTWPAGSCSSRLACRRARKCLAMRRSQPRSTSLIARHQHEVRPAARTTGRFGI